MCDVEVATANIEYICYSTPESAVKENLDPEIVNDPIFYPSEELLEKSEIFANLPDDINLVLDDLWVQVKTGGTDDTWALILVLCGFLLLYICVIIYKKRKDRKEKSK